MFNWLKNLLARQAERKKQKDEWSKYYADATQNPDNNNLPLEPEKDPWRS